MIHDPARDRAAPDPGLGFRAFVGLAAALMALTALGIDTMLPALPGIGRALGVASENERQWVIASFVLGMGGAQLFFGPLGDRYGRKPVLIAGLILYTTFSLVAGITGHFATLLVARALQGVGAAASRVLGVAIVRDCYSGREMARVMSLTFIVFLIVPILAPALGQAILAFGSWRLIFLLLGGFAAITLLWLTLGLRETLHRDYRRPLTVTDLAEAAREVVSQRAALGYTLGSTLLFGALMGYINSVQQIMADSFQRPGLLALAFALVGGGMAVGAFGNSRLVHRYGMRLISHVALIGFVAVALIHLIVATSGVETVWTFMLLQALQMFCFSLIGSNFGALAMEPVGHVAGMAASLQGFASTVGGALLGVAIGQQFDGSTVPVVAGFLSVGVASLIVVLATERGRLFSREQHAEPVAAR